jgi:hypothetical protein
MKGSREMDTNNNTTRAFEIANWAVETGRWTNDTACQFVQDVRDGKVDEETVKFFENSKNS